MRKEEEGERLIDNNVDKTINKNAIQIILHCILLSLSLLKQLNGKSCSQPIGGFAEKSNTRCGEK